MNMTDSDPHKVIVTVEADGTVVCTPEQVTVLECETVLKFLIETDGYVFPKDNAVVVTNPGQQFPFPSRTVSKRPTKATLYDHNSTAGDFKYTVYVQDVATGKILERDPTILNGP